VTGAFSKNFMYDGLSILKKCCLNNFIYEEKNKFFFRLFSPMNSYPINLRASLHPPSVGWSIAGTIDTCLNTHRKKEGVLRTTVLSMGYATMVVVETPSQCPAHKNRVDQQQPQGASARNFSEKCPSYIGTDAGEDNNTFSSSKSWWPFASAADLWRTGGNNINVPVSTEESLQHRQAPHPDQTIPLPTHRVVSSIPRGARPLEGDTEEKAVQPHWVYPSEQQFYNALRRKGYTADAESMSTVVQIHNAVNERTWKHICQWETELHAVEKPRLVRFMGRPNDRSPRAWCNVILFGKQPPFDRHDWYIDRGDGVERRYVIDFYEGKKQTNSHVAAALPSMYLDVRPAVDNPRAALDRIRMAVRQMLPGIFGPSSANPNYEHLNNISSEPPISKPNVKN
jgi:cytochrome c heme-lyase